MGGRASRRWAPVIAVTAALATALASWAAAAAPPRVDVDALMKTMRTLASPEMQGRKAGSPGGVLARRYIHDAFEHIGLEPAVPGYDQHFPVKTTRTRVTPPNDATLDGANVLGRVSGTDRAARTIVVSAHYDHLGIVDGRMYPGADDNASGVAALIECARYVHAHQPRHTMIFAAFDAEEIGLKGAEAFVDMPPVPRASLAIDVNFDMVGSGYHRRIYAAGTHEFPWLMRMLEAVRRRSAVPVLYGHDVPHLRGMDDWTQQSDHGRFYAAGIPFVYFGVEDHPGYHEPTDTADTIDPKFFGQVADMLLDAVTTLDRQLP